MEIGFGQVRRTIQGHPTADRHREDHECQFPLVDIPRQPGAGPAGSKIRLLLVPWERVERLDPATVTQAVRASTGISGPPIPMN